MSIRIAKVFDIPVKLHTSFGLVFLFIAYIAFQHQLKAFEIFVLGMFMIIMFLCVVLHEYGHALMARKFNIRTKDIVLSPIGGVARLVRMPEKPYQELLISIAGPLVNILIAFILFLVLIFLQDTTLSLTLLNDLDIQKTTDFIKVVLFLNLGLFFFNLIPAFPMDGGRILRALLSLKWDRTKATRIASIVGRIISVGFLGYGLYSGQFVLAAIGVFIFFMAGVEYRQLRLQQYLKEKMASDIMKPSFTKIRTEDTYSQVIQAYKNSKESNFLVFDYNDHLVGSIPELYIKDVLKSGDTNRNIASLMSDRVASIKKDMPLHRIINTMQKEGLAIVGVVDDEKLLGVIDRSMIMKYLKKI